MCGGPCSGEQLILTKTQNIRTEGQLPAGRADVPALSLGSGQARPGGQMEGRKDWIYHHQAGTVEISPEYCTLLAYFSPGSKPNHSLN